jgi:RNA polymerase sigma-70 factor, ECF subfamily
MEPEVALVEAARAGDRGAFARLVERYQKPVFSVAYRMLGTPEDAEDAAQEAFLRAFRSLGAYDRKRPFSTWLLSIVAHHCIDRLRRRRHPVLSLDAVPTWRWTPAETVDPERAAEVADEAAQIQAGLNDLPDDYRLVVVLRYWHDFGYSEIASILGETEAAVKSRLHRARLQLARYLVQSGVRHGLPSPSVSDGAPTAPVGGKPCNAILPAT